MKRYLFTYMLTIACLAYVRPQDARDDGYLKGLVARFKNDVRGPYKDIRWFCTDGSVRTPRDPCPEDIGPGVQHARYKDEVVSIGSSNHIYFSQILAATSVSDFWDTANDHSRLKQYQLDHYLRTIDNGWILQKGQFYRGAVQAEDEESRGIAFYHELLADDEVLKSDYFIIRQSLRDVPHRADENLGQLMRSQSKVISDEFPQFMDLRVKIHGRPEASDADRVNTFRQKYAQQLPRSVDSKLKQLLTTLDDFYKPVDIKGMVHGSAQMEGTSLGNSIESFVSANDSGAINPGVMIPQAAQLMMEIREGILEEKRPSVRLELLDISNFLESLIFKNAPAWQPANLKEQLDKICNLGLATAGAGYLEQWEWEKVQNTLRTPDSQRITLADLTTILETARGVLEWSAAMVKATYQEVVHVYTGFEPKASGFIDDRIRGSLVLPLGKSVGELGDFIATESALTNKVMDIPNQSTVRGLNPGYAFGQLVVVADSPETMEVASDKIYIFQRAPSDLKPVAGIATVAEGNMVSHVQLLARNLGIPNAAVSDENFQNLKRFDGQLVFYAVSNKGNVILKPESRMTPAERELFAVKERSDEKIAVPIDKIRLDQVDILNLREVDSGDSGELCGPKAANLGQLKKMFPENVVEGLVIPFGIFRSHMDQEMPGQQTTYWGFLKTMFGEAERMRSQGISEAEVENYQLRQLELLREAIRIMPLQAEFLSNLERDFSEILGTAMGSLPVFLRSDTNMEDLKDFTGAGLNLTIFNVLGKDKILDGIRAVWASPYSERSFKWRQKYLLNPENVFPSILVIPSVDVDYSGVLITKGISSGNDTDLTVAFSRGAGGAVDGQSAETYTILEKGGYRLLAPAREPYYNTLPAKGGTGRKSATFEKPVLKAGNIEQIRSLAASIRKKLPGETGTGYRGAYDVELGFKDNTLWLFQIRPFVENKKALSSAYLESITPKVSGAREISLTAGI